ncbi:MAG: type IV toxin-antitoxin system AbiEi family antitoxin domain-containing protein [Gordonia paraffinivorans]
MLNVPTDRHGIVLRSRAVAAGVSDSELSQAVARGQLVRLTRGAFAVAVDRRPRDHHRLASIAVAAASVDAVLSHQSAATVLGLEMLRPDFQRVHLSVAVGSGAHRTPTRHEHEAVLHPDDVLRSDGVRVTSLERTAVDVACTSTMGFAGALAVFDSALRLGADRDRMASMLLGARRGVGPARRGLRHADGRAENPGESWGRAQMIDAGLPVDDLQREFLGRDGELIARTDFAWRDVLVGEFDGMVKYQKHFRPGETPFEAMRREKDREDALRRMGIMVIRWTWDDLVHGRVVPMLRDWLTRLGLIAA